MLKFINSISIQPFIVDNDKYVTHRGIVRIDSSFVLQVSYRYYGEKLVRIINTR